MKKYIKISEENKKWIEQALKISRVMLNHALYFDPKGAIAIWQSAYESWLCIVAVS